jgi:hypothetical protein
MLKKVRVCRVRIDIPEKLNDWFRVELDSHADTCCVGCDVMITNEMQKTVKVLHFIFRQEVQQWRNTFHVRELILRIQI